MAVFARLHDLGQDIVEQVDQLLISGEKPVKVARWLQGDLKLLTDLQESSVKKNLERYRAQELKGKVLENLTDRAMGKSAAGLHRQLMAIDEMTDLAVLQRKRLDKILVREDGMPKGLLLKQASDETRLLKELLVELGKLQLETGIMRRAPKTITGQVSDPESGSVRQFTWTEEQEDLYKQLEGIPEMDGSMIEDADFVEGD